jgi:hypothetical protein
MNNTSHINLKLKDKIEILDLGGRIKIFSILGHCGVEVNETTDSEAKQSFK